MKEKEKEKVNFENIDRIISYYYSEIGRLAKPEVLQFMRENNSPVGALMHFDDIKDNWELYYLLIDLENTFILHTEYTEIGRGDEGAYELQQAIRHSMDHYVQTLPSGLVEAQTAYSVQTCPQQEVAELSQQIEEIDLSQPSEMQHDLSEF